MRFLVPLVVLTLTIPVSARRENVPDVIPGTRMLNEVLMRQRSAEVRRTMSRSRLAALTTDVGNITVMQDDGTLFSKVNPFNLANRSILFTRKSDGTYVVSSVTPQFDTTTANAGQVLALGDDDSKLVSLAFAFPFYKSTYTSIYVNSDGNLTFNSGDSASTDRDLGRMLGGPPRLSPFFQDLNDTEGGQITANVQPSKAVFSWLAVQRCCLADGSSGISLQTFQVILTPDGSIQYNYGSVTEQSAIVGISPGSVGGRAASAIAVDFATASASAPAALVEVFSTSVNLCLSCLAQQFYATHEDVYDILVLWSTVNYPLSGGADAFADTNLIRNDVTGIGYPGGQPPAAFDYSSTSGSLGRLQTITEMGLTTKYPSDPTLPVGAVGNSTTFSVLAHEIGHRWLSYIAYPTASDPQSGLLLDSIRFHWSFVFNNDASFMYSNRIRDNGNGTFTTIGNTQQYSALDRYLLGLLPPDQVPDSFVVTNSGINPDTFPTDGRTFSGTRTPVQFSQIVAANGPRLPPSNMSPHAFNIAFLLLTPAGSGTPTGVLSQIDNYRTQFPAYFSNASGGLGSVRTSLVKAASISPSPVAAGSITTTVQASINLQSPAPASGVTFQLQSADSTIAAVPASVTVPAGALSAPFSIRMGNAGNTTITSSAAGYDTSVVPVASTTGAVVNAGTFAAGYAVSPGSIASFFGPFLTTSTSSASSLPLPTTLGNVSLSVNGTLAPLFYSSAGQVNFQVPFETQGSYANLVVNRNGQSPLTVPLLLTSAAPGIFTVSQDGKGPAAALHGTTNLPITASSPAQAGEVISLFASGLGAVNPAVPSGTPASATQLSTVAGTVTATVAGQSANVAFAGLAPTFVGLYQVNVQIPAGITNTNAAVVLSVGSSNSNTVTIPVQ